MRCRCDHQLGKGRSDAVCSSKKKERKKTIVKLKLKKKKKKKKKKRMSKWLWWWVKNKNKGERRKEVELYGRLDDDDHHFDNAIGPWSSCAGSRGIGKSTQVVNWASLSTHFTSLVRTWTTSSFSSFFFLSLTAYQWTELNWTEPTILIRLRHYELSTRLASQFLIALQWTGWRLLLNSSQLNWMDDFTLSDGIRD